jgi:hypothetical protein
MARAKRSSRGNGQSSPEPRPRIGRKDLLDPDRDVTEPARPAPEGEPGRSDPDAGAGRPVQLEAPASVQRAPASR